jgi:hypothetical protein
MAISKTDSTLYQSAARGRLRIRRQTTFRPTKSQARLGSVDPNRPGISHLWRTPGGEAQLKELISFLLSTKRSREVRVSTFYAAILERLSSSESRLTGNSSVARLKSWIPMFVWKTAGRSAMNSFEVLSKSVQYTLPGGSMCTTYSRCSRQYFSNDVPRWSSTKPIRYRDCSMSDLVRHFLI